MGPDGAGLSCPGSNVVADFEEEGARLENPPTPETIGRDLHSAVESQSLADGLEQIRTDQTRWSTIGLPQFSHGELR